jgi:hypothetical protein
MEAGTLETRQHDTIRLMPTDHILSLLIQEKDKIDRAIAALQGTPRSVTARRTAKHTESAGTTTAPTPNHKPKRRRWTLAMKRAAAERSKAMWAAKRRKAGAKKG